MALCQTVAHPGTNADAKLHIVTTQASYWQRITLSQVIQPIRYAFVIFLLLYFYKDIPVNNCNRTVYPPARLLTGKYWTSCIAAGILGKDINQPLNQKQK